LTEERIDGRMDWRKKEFTEKRIDRKEKEPKNDNGNK
jgi:hypothetical protein